MKSEDWTSVRAVVFDAYGTLVRTKGNGNYAPLPRNPGQRLNKRSLMIAAMTQPETTSGLYARTGFLAKNVPASSDGELIGVSGNEDAIAVLRELAHRGYQTGVASNLAPMYAAPVIACVEGLVEVFCWSFEMGLLKPDPKFFAVLCERLSCCPSEVLMVGDSYRQDYKGAIDAGLQAVRLPRKGGGREEILSLILERLPKVTSH